MQKSHDATPRFSASAWFGSQFGASLWLLLAAVQATRTSWSLAAAVAGLFLGLNLVGLGLWRARERIAPLVAIETLIVVAGIAAALALVLLERSGLRVELGQPNPWPFLAVFPFLMLLFAGQAWLRMRQPKKD